jgi:hypothetical protein
VGLLHRHVLHKTAAAILLNAPLLISERHWFVERLIEQFPKIKLSPQVIQLNSGGGCFIIRLTHSRSRQSNIAFMTGVNEWSRAGLLSHFFQASSYGTAPILTLLSWRSCICHVSQLTIVF